MTTWTEASETPEYVVANYVRIGYVNLTFEIPDEAATSWANASEASPGWSSAADVSTTWTNATESGTSWS